ncbi:MAG TPA: aspartate-semialdehyde dehydrogenase [Oligoflexia bacterium]|nr:aspartate-semialdehyde dehydrogenase [Oligoflexia bacterium]HMP49681.1 aspartate-semialdehyde dehydrogenase [Oligoflexia bacterium]
MDQREVSVAVVGATGVVGREMLEVLEERQFPYSQLKVLASSRSVGESVDFADKECIVEELSADSFDNVDIALFSAGAKVSETFGPVARDKGVIVIDNSSYFRMHDDVPLVVPEVNNRVLREHLQGLSPRQGTIIANPNCSTIQLAVVLSPLDRKFGLKRVVVSTYQSVSGAGKQGMDELWDQSLALFNQEEIKIEKFSKQIAFNVLPHCDLFLENGYTKEEMKVILESRKILKKKDLKITATSVRVPVFSCHSESVNIEFENPCSAENVRSVLRESQGIVVLDDPTRGEYPNAAELAGTDATYVGRIREDDSVASGVNLWIVADNLRKGAALNAVQIAEIVLSSQRPH